MIIKYFGKQALKIAQGDVVVAVNPVSKSSKCPVSPAKFGSNIVFITTNHPDFNGVETVTYGEQTPFKVTGAGDYEISGIFAKGIQSKGEVSKVKYLNTIYSILFDKINICILGPVDSGELSSEVIEGIETPDILILPIGGNGTLNPIEAHKLAIRLEAKVVIPVDYGKDMEKDALKLFLNEAGMEKAEELDKFTFKKKDVEELLGKVVVLSSS